MTKSGMLILGLLSLLVIAISWQSTVNRQSAGQELDRTILPIPAPEYPAITELDARKAQAPPPFAVEAPEGAPNVVVVLIDDIGFGAASMFGGSIQTPSLDRLAQGGLRYNQFHTTALLFAHPHGDLDRPQSPLRQRGLGHGGGDRVSRATRAGGPEASRRSPRCCA